MIVIYRFRTRDAVKREILGTEKSEIGDII
ncbi:MAG: hypothetical protein PWR13_772 [Archaeoglobi archaeon]|nr:hypothetical protein [Archaeoglobi archaeon]